VQDWVEHHVPGAQLQHRTPGNLSFSIAQQVCSRWSIVALRLHYTWSSLVAEFETLSVALGAPCVCIIGLSDKTCACQCVLSAAAGSASPNCL
jgi:hypothetical protein